MRKILILLLVTTSICAQNYYSSNSLAMEIESIDEFSGDFKDYGEWVLEKNETDTLIEKNLYNNGQLKRTLIEKNDRSGRTLYSSLTINGILREESLYSEKGLLEKEVFYKPDGSIDIIELYRYNESDELLGIDVQEGEEEQKSYYYSIRSDGSLRSISGNEDSSRNSYEGVLFLENLLSESRRELIFRNHKGYVEKILLYENNQLIRDEVRTYWTEEVVKEIRIVDKLSERETIQQMDKRGNLEEEEVYKDRKLQSGTYYFYNGEKIVRKEKKEPGIREHWLYTYEGDQLTFEEYYKKDVLIHRKVFSGTDQSTYELELIDRGEVFLIIHFEKDVKIREEYVSNGVVTKTRELRD